MMTSSVATKLFSRIQFLKSYILSKFIENSAHRRSAVNSQYLLYKHFISKTVTTRNTEILKKRKIMGKKNGKTDAEMAIANIISLQ